MNQVAMASSVSSGTPLPLPEENAYGHTKKLSFVRDAVARHRERLGRDTTLLDFGCGNGTAVSRYLIGEGVDFYGVDTHAPSLRFATEHFGGARAHFLDRVPEELRFDVIVYADVLEHLEDPVSILSAHRNQLAPEGIVVGAVPNGYGPFEMESRIDGWLHLSDLLGAISRAKRRLLSQPARDEGLPYNHDSGHIMFFTRGALEEMAGAAGLRVTRFAHGVFFGASLSGMAIVRSQWLLHWNTRVADRLPHWAVSVWYFELQPE